MLARLPKSAHPNEKKALAEKVLVWGDASDIEIPESALQKARDIAMRELQERAQALGANAVVGIDLDYEVLGQGNGMLMVSASGTAVVAE